MVSAVITTYKRDPDILKRAVNSVLTQTYKDIELIVVDDSPDDYEKRSEVEAYVLGILGHAVHYIKHEKNKGACAARNTGIEASKGEYIAFLDDDDEWLPAKTEIQMSIMREDIAIVGCGSITVNDTTGKEKMRKIAFYKENVYEKLLYYNFLGSVSFPLIRKDALVEAGMFDEKLSSSQDLDMWLRIAKNNKVDYIEEPLCLYHIHGGERITTNLAGKIAGKERIIEKNAEYLVNHREIYAQKLIGLSRFYYLNGQAKKAAGTAAKAIAMSPKAVRYIPKNIKSIIANKVKR